MKDDTESESHPTSPGTAVASRSAPSNIDAHTNPKRTPCPSGGDAAGTRLSLGAQALHSSDILALWLVCASYIYLAPYTKVEESFNVQAVYDLLEKDYLRPLDYFDHVAFPGVVSRTFIAPIVIAALVYPIKYLCKLSPISMLMCVRLMLASITVASLVCVRNALAKRHGLIVGYLYVVLSAVQFHLPFYAGRPLANIFALILTNISLAQRLRSENPADILRSHAIMAFAVAVLRSELSILLFWTVLFDSLFTKRVVFFTSAVTCILAAFAGALVSIGVDSHFWGPRVMEHPFRYPELEVFYFNAIQGKSSAWGTAPTHWYFSSALPRALVGTIPLVFLGLYASRGLARRITFLTVLPALAFVAVYSALPHKELRFIFYAIPALNVAAAHGASALVANAMSSIPVGKDKRPTPIPDRIASAVTLAVCLGASAAVTMISVAASYNNYPGAEALLKLSELRPCGTYPKLNVHIDAHAASNGISQFVEAQTRCPGWTFSREEGLDSHAIRSSFTHLVGKEKAVDGYEILHEQESFSDIDVKKMKLYTAPDVYVLERIETIN